MTDMRRFARIFILSLAVTAAVLGVNSLANAANPHGTTVVQAAVSIADDTSWQ
ncbi:hypothetical protein ACIBCA_16105 [Kitasatospora sp. NPDC051170]|uniref:hypothetical protein n=1 Tax=Kitasatospora sp. NPDC051170 TaxID=3364056 RepID=UPI0037AA47A9